MTDHCLGCEFTGTHQNMVTLLDGTEVCSSCPAWRHQCEAQYVVDRPTTQDRRAYLEIVEKKRGFEAANELRATIRELWDMRNKAPVAK